MSGTCKDCKWWELLQEKDGWGECLMALTKNGAAEQEDTLAVAYAPLDDVRWGVLATAPDFGCVQFENKNE